MKERLDQRDWLGVGSGSRDIESVDDAEGKPKDTAKIQRFNIFLFNKTF